MNKKIIFGLFVICLIIISTSTVSAFWFFDSGTDVNVNGVDLHIPEGFDKISKDTLNIDTNYEAYTYDNPETHEFISIAVCDNLNDESDTVNNLINMNYDSIEINGKTVYYKIFLNQRYGYVYLENGKYVSIEVPIWCDSEGIDHSELVAKIIKWCDCMDEDIASNVEGMPIVKGIVVSIVFAIIGLLSGIGFIGLFGIIIGGGISGFSTNNSTSYAVIYGAIVGFISSFLTVFSVFSIPVCIILGIFGAFIGKVFQSNLN